MEASFAFQQMSCPFPDLLLKELSIGKEMADKNYGEEEQQQKNEDIYKGKNNPYVFFPLEGADNLITVLDIC